MPAPVICAFCVDVDGTDRRAAVYGNGRTPLVMLSTELETAMSVLAIMPLPALVSLKVTLLAQHNAAGDSNTRQVDSADAVCNDEIAVDGLADTGNAVSTYNNARPPWQTENRLHRRRCRATLTDDLANSARA